MAKKTQKNHTITVLVCARCKHSWVPRIAHVRLCPSCKSPYWDTPKQEKKRKNKA